MDYIKDTLREYDISFVIVAPLSGVYFEDEWSSGRQGWGFKEDEAHDDYYGFDLIGDYVSTQSIPYINSLEAFLSQIPDDSYFFDHDGSLTPEGNEFLSQSIVQSKVFLDVLKDLN